MDLNEGIYRNVSFPSSLLNVIKCSVLYNFVQLYRNTISEKLNCVSRQRVF